MLDLLEKRPKIRTLLPIWDNIPYNPCMELYITHDSALEYWRRQGKKRDKDMRRQRNARIPAVTPNAQLLQQASAVGLSRPLDILVTTLEARRPSSRIRPHVFGGVLPDNSVISLGSGLFVSSPELCFFQMASKLTLVELIELGYELCGSFARPALTVNPKKEKSEADEECLYNLPELTNVKKLTAYVERMKGVNGYGRASKALHFIADDSGSPMEAVLTMLLTLPYRYGGYGLPMPKLNYRIILDKVAQRSANKSYLKCDLFWPLENLAVEYDSEKHHALKQKIAEDAVRRNTLSSLGIPPIIVTKQQLYSAFKLEMVALQLSRKLGKQLKHKKPGFYKARSLLREALL